MHMMEAASPVAIFFGYSLHESFNAFSAIEIFGVCISFSMILYWAEISQPNRNCIGE